MNDFQVLYEKYAQDVFRFAYFLCGNRADAEDIASETFVRAWTASGGIRQSTVKAYLLVIARNCYVQSLRRKGRESPLDEDFVDPRQAPYDSAEQRAELNQVMQGLRELPELDRTALLMSAAQELSYEQIAETLGLSIGAVKTKIHRARLKLEQGRKKRS
jgi:RNA polymerase sigma-70 factor (ECF subfamily)